MAIRNPSPEELEKLLNKDVEKVSINTPTSINEKINNNKVNNNKSDNNITNSPNDLKPKRSRFEPDPIKCSLISGSNFIPEGYIFVRRLNTEEESKLSQIKDSTTLNSTINAIFQTAIKSNISISDMPIIDKMYIFAFILNISYVKQINANDLINCEDCNDKYRNNIDFIDDIKINCLESSKTPFNLTLESFDKPYQLCFNLPKIKNENSIYNKDVSEIISSITVFLRDEKGIDIPQEEWIEIFKWIDNDDKKRITEILTDISSYGENVNLKIEKCNNPSCRIKGTVKKIPMDELFGKMFSSINDK
jgi:hypothetical protein